MAYVSVSGNNDDAESIRAAYRGNLGRDASDDEVNNWLSGAYGGGSISDRVNQIASSHEAQQRHQSAPPMTPTIPGFPENIPTLGNQNPNVSRPMDTPGGVDTGFSGGIGDAYQQYLGRSASPDEISSWWSGQFGHGQGWGGYNNILEAIRNSAEARSRNNGQAPAATTQSIEYWQRQGVNPSDIFDQNGQTRPGWERYGSGYRRTGTTGTTNVAGPQNGNFEQWFLDLTRGKPISPATLKSLEPVLNQYGIKLGPANARGFIDTIILPDGTVKDVIIGATPDGGQQWSFFTPGPHTAGGVGGGPAPGNQYGDAYTQFLENLIKSRIGNLQGGYDDSARQQHAAALQARAQALSTGNAQLDQLLKYLQERFTDLQGPGYTGAENEAIRTSALDPIERDRTAARQRMAEQLAARGHSPDSGVFQDAMRRLDAEFDGIRGVTQTQLTTNDLARREDRAQRAEMIGGQIADIPEQRAREQLDVFGALDRLAALSRSEEEARSREAISYAGVLSDLGPQRLQLAMQAAGMGGNPASLGGVLTNIAGMNQNASAYNAQNSNSLWSGLGTIAAIMARSGQSGFSGMGI